MVIIFNDISIVMFFVDTFVMANLRMTIPTIKLEGASGDLEAVVALEVEATAPCKKRSTLSGLLVWSIEQEAPCSVLEIIWSYMEDAYTL